MEIITDDTKLEETAQLERAGFYWRTADSGVRGLVCAPLESEGFPNAFSTRLGGVSPMPVDALSLAGFNEDSAENIYENRRRFLKLFDGRWTLAACWQDHGAEARVVKDVSDAVEAPGASGESIHADALVTNAARVLLGVKTADCVPVLLCDKGTQACAAIHAGWRGTLARIVPKTLERMRAEYGTRAEDVRAAIGPAAGACCYEVGPDVIEAYRENFDYADELLTPTGRENHARIDIQRANRQQLIDAGLSTERIHLAPLCTMDRTDLFFSYRREKRLHGRVGRLMSVIGRA